MFEGFVHPAIAWGTALAAVPLAIHLLNRQRHKPIQWAAMRFVLAAYRKTRRRVQLENLLLLLLRMGAVALLALAIARPFASGTSPLAALTEDRRDVVLVLDGSASTGYREDVDTVFERIVARAKDIAGDLEEGRGDRAHVLLAGRYPRLLAWNSPEKALSVLGTLTEPTTETLDLTAALGEVLAIVEKDAGGTSGNQSTLEVRVFTDMQRRSFELDLGEALASAADASLPPTDPDASATAPLLVETLDALAEFGVRVFVEDCGPAPLHPPNLTIESIEPLAAIVGAGQPVEIAVSIAGHGPSPRAAVRVALAVDGERQPSQRLDVPAGGSAEAIFSVQFAGTGAHSLLAELEGDRLAVDDVRPHVVTVPPPIRVLVVNGARASTIEDDETGYLMAVLEPPDDGNLPGSGSLSPFDPREVTPELLIGSDVELGGFDVIVLANVANLSPNVVKKLEETVAGGASLIIAAGDRVDTEAYNQKLFRPDGSGLSPVEFTRRVSITDRRSSFYRVSTFDEDHPALAFFADDIFKPLLTEVPIYEFLATRPLPSADVIARLDDETKSPLLIERPYDSGRVLLFTSTFDNAWNRISESPNTLIPFVHEIMRYTGERRSGVRNVAPGDAVSMTVDVFPRAPELVRPDGSRRPIEGQAEEALEGRWALPEISGADTEVSGLYQIAMEGARPEPFAVQLDPAEGNLERMSAAELEALHPAFAFVDRSGAGGGDEDPRTPPRGEIWRWLALAALIFLVSESLWGAWLGHKRRIA